MSVLAVAGLCILADRLAAYPLPFKLGANAAQFAYQALVFAAPAAVAGYALVHGVTRKLYRPKSGRKSSASSAGPWSEFPRRSAWRVIWVRPRGNSMSSGERRD
jgi:hypothetical protein